MVHPAEVFAAIVDTVVAWPGVATGTAWAGLAAIPMTPAITARVVAFRRMDRDELSLQVRLIRFTVVV
jgi:hypothetical protein